MIRLLPAILAAILAACASGGTTPVTPPPSAGAATPAGASQGASSAGAEAPIVNQGPAAWNRGPYDLAGGTYPLDWETDGNCSALYFGIVGTKNGYKESPPTAGDVALKDMLKGSRTITDVPAGSYYFNVSQVSCRKYSATLTHVP